MSIRIITADATRAHCTTPNRLVEKASELKSVNRFHDSRALNFTWKVIFKSILQPRLPMSFSIFSDCLKTCFKLNLEHLTLWELFSLTITLSTFQIHLPFLIKMAAYEYSWRLKPLFNTYSMSSHTLLWNSDNDCVHLTSLHSLPHIHSQRCQTYKTSY